MELKVDNFTIRLHRASLTSNQEEVRRLTSYVTKICELGQKEEQNLNINK